MLITVKDASALQANALDVSSATKFGEMEVWTATRCSVTWRLARSTTTTPRSAMY